MRGSDQRSGELFSYVDLEKRVRPDHPLHANMTPLSMNGIRRHNEWHGKLSAQDGGLTEPEIDCSRWTLTNNSARLPSGGPFHDYPAVGRHNRLKNHAEAQGVEG
jgi:hypothetical protein